MAKLDADLDPFWQDLDWALGSVFFMGWDGTEVTPQIRHLIEEHHLGSILLTAKNLKSVEQTARIVQELQTIAHQAGHPHPLLIAVDQENGGVNSLFDPEYTCQFPSSMGIAAAGSLELAYTVAKATATELAAVGVNLILGPVLDVLTNARYQPLGVRASGDDFNEVSQYGLAALRGYRDAGLATCGKHFPSYGNLDFLGSSLDMPIITQTLEELSLSALVPFRHAIASGMLGAMFVGGCAVQSASMNVNHACLSAQVVDELLRDDLGFNGVAISECLEMEALRNEIGVKTGTVMAVEAGCDLVLLCRAYDVQLEAISGLKLGVENGIISRERIYTSLSRVLQLKATCTSWAQALNPPGISSLAQIHPSHLALSKRAYDSSIAVVRDKEKLIPLSASMRQEDELLLLTPLVKPLPASAATKSAEDRKETSSTNHDKWIHPSRAAAMSGESVFRELGRSLARARHGKLCHTSYTANGVRPVHENLIQRASCIILVTADANRNLYQAGFTKHVATMCSMFRATGQNKSLIVVAVSSPYDFAMDKSIGTYLCTFDFTETAMHSLVHALFGAFVPQGSLPGTLRKTKKAIKSRQHWLVEPYIADRDGRGLDELISAIARASAPNQPFLLSTRASAFDARSYGVAMEEQHFVVRNSSTQALYGFCATYFTKGTGYLAAILVDPAKRNLSIGNSLHRRSLRSLLERPGIKKVQLGVSFPGVYLGIPTAVDDSSNLKGWFAQCGGWDILFPRRLTNLTIRELPSWTLPDGLLQNIQRASISFDLIHGLDNAESVLALVSTHAGPEVFELYKAALRETTTCGVVRAKSPVDSLLGTVIICSPNSPLKLFIPPLQQQSQRPEAARQGLQPIGGILAPVVPATAHSSLVLQGLALMGVRQNKAQRSASSVLSFVQGDLYEPLLAMGFEVLQSFEEITNLPENWSEMSQRAT